jgi:hypothetical protein
MKTVVMAVIALGLLLQGGDSTAHKASSEQSAPAAQAHVTANVQSTAGTVADDREIQQKLEKFTGWLVVVGALQFAALIAQGLVFFFTLQKIELQANYMKHHADSFVQLATAARDNAEAIKSQAATMQGQLTAMEGQLTEMRRSGEQTDLMIEQATKQAESAAIAADASQKSAQALMDGERAWLLVENLEIPLDPISLAIQNAGDGPVHTTGDVFGVSIPGATFEVWNYGKTPGTILSVQAKLETGTSRDTPPNPKDVFEMPEYAPLVALVMGQKTEEREEHVVPQGGHRVELAPLSGLGSRLSDEKITRIKNDADFLWAYGVVRYRDVYDRQHETRFCYRYIVPPEEPLIHFCLRGPEAYNKAT